MPRQQYMGQQSLRTGNPALREAGSSSEDDDESVGGGFDAAAEFRMIWLENHFDADQIIERLESCDKCCKSCNKVEMADCLLELRESVHSLAMMFKDVAKLFVDADCTCPQSEESLPPAPAHGLYG